MDDPDGSSSSEVVAEINMTPFVDVVLVLLIIFMITSPLALSGVNILLPKEHSKPVHFKTEPAVLSVTETGDYFLDKVPVKPEDLSDKLKLLQGSQTDFWLYVRGDKRVPYGSVMFALALAQRVGIKNLSLLSEPAQTARSTSSQGSP